MQPTAVTGDSHFDGSPNGRLAECVRIHDWMADDWFARDVGLVLHGGDLFEGLGTTSAAERMAVARWLMRVGAFADVLILRGNHDPLGELPLYEHLEAQRCIRVAETVGLYRFEAADVEVVAVPWPRKGLAMLEMVEGEAGTDIRESIRRMMTWYGTQPRRCSRRVVLAHAMICGAKASTGQPMVGTDCEIAVEDLALCDPDVIFLSHVHKSQQWTVATPSGRLIEALYAGSNGRGDFGEMEEKHYLLADEVIPTDPIRIVEISTPTTPMLHWTARWDGETIVHEQEVDLSRSALARLQITIPGDQRDAARAAIAAFVAAAAGYLVEVHVEEIPIVVQRARAPEMATAQTIETQLEVAWAAKSIELYDERRTRVLALGRQIDDEVRRKDPRERARKGGGVRVNWLEVGDLGPFVKPFRLDVATLKGPIVAVHGPNEAGKSTLLELLFLGLCYRTMATRDTLPALATSMTARLLGSFDMGGKTWLVKHEMKEGAARGSTVSDGTTNYCPNGKASEFDAWAAQQMPPLEVMLAGQFVAQGATGFLGLGSAKRKEIIQAALGIDGVEARAVEARSRLDATKRERDALAARLSDAEGRIGDILALDKAAEIATFHVEQRGTELAAADASLGSARAAAESSAVAMASYREKLAERSKLAGALESARRHLDRCTNDHRLANEAAGRLVDHATARTMRDEIVRALDGLRQLRADVAARLQRAEGDVVAAASASRRARDAQALTSRRLREARTKITLADELRPQAARVKETRDAAFVATDDEAKAHTAVLRAMKERDDFKDGRATKLRDGHEQIVKHDIPAAECRSISWRALTADDVGLSTLDPRALDEVREKHDEAIRVRKKTEIEWRAAQSAAERLAGMGDVENELGAADAADLGAIEAVRQAEIAEAATPNSLTVKAELADIDSRTKKLNEALAPLDAGLRWEQSDQDLAADLPRRKSQLDLATTASAAAAAALEAVPPPVAPTADAAAQEVQRLERATADARTALTRAQQAKADADAKIATATAAGATAAELRKAHEELVEKVSDLTLLAQTFGRTGIQALMVDAAIPEISTIVNELLGECFGPRWRVRLVTTEPVGDDPTREQEVFKVLVTDGKTGKERDARSNSGGAKVPISEALSLALTVIACKRNAAERPTLIRDESGAALDPENSKGYVEMLRLAAKRVGAEHVFVVSHNAAIWPMCDSRIRVEAGAVTVE